MPPWSLLHLHRYDRPGEDQGQRYHRVDNLVSLLNTEVSFHAQEISWLHPQASELACAANLLVIHALSDPALLGIVDWRRRHGLPTLFELPDDPSAPGPWRKQNRIPSPLILSNLYHLASHCDGVQFSSAGLRDRFGILSSRTGLLPNAIAIPLTPPPKSSGFVIGWGGTTSHREDLIAIAPALTEFCHHHPDVSVTLKGNPGMLREVFAELPPEQFEVEPFGSPQSYRDFLRKLHVGLAPLIPTTFNLGRTDVKLFDYAAAGAAVIAQDAPPYRPHAPHVLLFQTPRQMLDHLEQLYADRGFLSSSAARLHAYAWSVRSPDSVRRLHCGWYASHLPQDTLPRPLPAISGTADAAFRELSLHFLQQQKDLESEAALALILDRLPAYEQTRFRLASLLVKQRRISEAERIGGPLLNSIAFHDPYLLLLLPHVTPDRGETLRQNLRSPFFRIFAEPVPTQNFEHYVDRVLNVAPYHFLTLSYRVRRLRGDPSSQTDYRNLSQRLSLFQSSS